MAEITIEKLAEMYENLATILGVGEHPAGSLYGREAIDQGAQHFMNTLKANPTENPLATAAIVLCEVAHFFRAFSSDEGPATYNNAAFEKLHNSDTAQTLMVFFFGFGAKLAKESLGGREKPQH